MPTTNKPSTLRIVFAGTPDFAASALQSLLNYSRVNVVAVYTQPDRPVGRGRKLAPSAVKSLALENNIEVCQPENFKHEGAVTTLNAWQADFMIVAAYGLLLPKTVLDSPRFGCLNIHASLLPRWRGAAPIERAIEAGDRQTGITIMQMDEGLDTGAMLLKSPFILDETISGGDARSQLAELGGSAIVEALEKWFVDKLTSEVQNDALANYAPKINKSELYIDFQQSAVCLARKIRALASANNLYFELDGARIKIGAAFAKPNDKQQPVGTIVDTNKTAIQVACADGLLAITALQLPGKKMLSSRDVLNAKRDLFATGTLLQGAQ